MNTKMIVKLFKMEFASKLAYRGKLIVDVLVLSMRLFVPLLTWVAVYRSQAMVSGYSYSDMVTYLIVGNFVGLIFSLNHGSVFANMVKQGKLSTFLLRPAPLISNFLPRFCAQSIANGVVILAPALALVLMFGVKAPPLPSVMALVLVFASWLFAFQFGYAFGLLAFWVTEMWAVSHLTRSLMVIAGGTWFPLDLLPFGIGQILQYSPFSYLGYVSIKALTGRLSGDEIYGHLVVLIGWMIIFFFFSQYLLKRGLLRYEAVGA